MLSHGGGHGDCDAARGRWELAQLEPGVSAARDEMWNSRVCPVDN